MTGLALARQSLQAAAAATGSAVRSSDAGLCRAVDAPPCAVPLRRAPGLRTRLQMRPDEREARTEAAVRAAVG